MSSPLANTPEPPYFAVIFTSQRKPGDEGYSAMAERMLELASQQAGFLGVESVRDADGVGITVSYWSSLESIRAWKSVSEHRAAQELGRSQWYEDYRVRVCRVEREYGLND
jgi:heme-degrading monooxygenase HmoA